MASTDVSPPRLAAPHLGEKADEPTASRGNQASESCGDWVAGERQVQPSFQRERIDRSEAREDDTDLLLFAPKCCFERLVVLFRRVECRNDLGLESNRCPRELRLDGFEISRVYERWSARFPAGGRGGSVVVHGCRIDTQCAELRETVNLSKWLRLES